MKQQILPITNEHQTLLDILRWRALQHPNQRAYTFLLDGEEDAVHITYAEVDEQARAIGAWLQQMNTTGETDVNKAQDREGQTQERIEADLRAKLAEIFSISPSKIDFEQPIKSLGFSSLTAVSKSILKSAMVSSCPCNYFLKK